MMNMGSVKLEQKKLELEEAMRTYIEHPTHNNAEVLLAAIGSYSYAWYARIDKGE